MSRALTLVLVCGVACSCSLDEDPNTGLGPDIVDGRARVPAGVFVRGCVPDADLEYLCNNPQLDLNWNAPAAEIHLDEFWIDEYEVTVEQYHECSLAGACGPVESLGEWQTNGRHNVPMTAVAWPEADAYCKWRGGRLPTEHEWEKAARGTDSRRYPWGNEPPKCGQVGLLITYCEDAQVMQTQAVGAFPQDISPYGVKGMMGNAQEWTSDWLDPDFYQYSSSANPEVTEPVEHELLGLLEKRVVRGGYMQVSEIQAHTSLRSDGEINARYIGRIGFRCAYDDAPGASGD